MWRFLVPSAMHQVVQDVNIRDLKARGIKTILVDLDNTLVKYQKYECTPELEAWVRHVRDAGLEVCIVSNSRRCDAVAGLASRLGIRAVTRAGKPWRRGFARAIAMCGCEPQHTAVIGDQVFTDVLGGNRMGCYTVLVQPLGTREFIGTRLVRLIETLVLRRLRAESGRRARED